MRTGRIHRQRVLLVVTDDLAALDVPELALMEPDRAAGGAGQAAFVPF